MLRREFVGASLAAAGGVAVSLRYRPGVESGSPGLPPAWAVVPVVGDGRWIDVEPPAEGIG